MSLNRGEFICGSAGCGLSSAVALSGRASGRKPARIEAIAFDAFPIFDPRPVSAVAETLFPQKGAELVAAWRTRQFEYQWLRALSGQYADFKKTTEEALVFAAKLRGIDLTAESRGRLMRASMELKPWPDAHEALTTLKTAGIRLAFLSNMTEPMLGDGIRNGGLENIFEHVLSTDRIRTYKPDPRAYRMAVDAFRLRRDAILFVAFAGWDAAGATWFGYPTFWLNRLGLPPEEMGILPRATGKDLSALVQYVTEHRQGAADSAARGKELAG